ncbi:pentapeptide repeat-containing protein [Thermomonospora umbrina]|uniref:Uncharacterized protein YjbI with pentapeptide repeats n=1 Tax=Thermomonospora umbrina TaxID=111806 RepID=A0A3D9ST73_9ACTN|nr:pentapeptide repeat-containing protein [Thermomonospora umbrina]REE97680.1 uncharacterized protein YjbI with pentapeptide repeats [Thermomonospora umbrina]
METRQVRAIKVLLPSGDDHPRTTVTEPGGGDLTDITAARRDWSRLRLEDRSISGSILNGIVMAESHIERARITNTTLDGCDLASSRWTDVKLDRCVLRGCRLTGVQAHRITLSEVIFERCRLDYAFLSGLHASGATAFLDCVLREATIENSRLDGVVIADGSLAGLELVDTRLHGADLRGCDLQGISGLTSLTGCAVTGEQVGALTEAMLTELRIQVAD